MKSNLIVCLTVAIQGIASHVSWALDDRQQQIITPPITLARNKRIEITLPVHWAFVLSQKDKNQHFCSYSLLRLHKHWVEKRHIVVDVYTIPENTTGVLPKNCTKRNVSLVPVKKA